MAAPKLSFLFRSNSKSVQIDFVALFELNFCADSQVCSNLNVDCYSLNLTARFESIPGGKGTRPNSRCFDLALRTWDFWTFRRSEATHCGSRKSPTRLCRSGRCFAPGALRNAI